MYWLRQAELHAAPYLAPSLRPPRNWSLLTLGWKKIWGCSALEADENVARKNMEIL